MAAHLFPAIPAWPVGAFPARRTREAICRVSLQFNGGIVVDLPARGGRIPWFDPGIMCLTPDERQIVYDAKRAAGDQHCLLEFFDFNGSIYDEPGQPYQPFITKDWEQDQPGFLALVEEVIRAGFVPVIAFNGDNADSPELKSPASGHFNALRQLPILVKLLASSPYRDLNEDVLYARLWDGVFYGSTPEHIGEFGRAFRALVPHGHLAIEHQPGRIPCGEGGGDYEQAVAAVYGKVPDVGPTGGKARWRYREAAVRFKSSESMESMNTMAPLNDAVHTEQFASAGLMTTYDVILAELNAPPADNTLWQIAGRMQRPYHRPPDQPADDDPNPPYYLGAGNARGPYFWIPFEWAGIDAQGHRAGTYYWVRALTPEAQAEQRATNDAFRGYLRATGAVTTG